MGKDAAYTRAAIAAQIRLPFAKGSRICAFSLLTSAFFGDIVPSIKGLTENADYVPAQRGQATGCKPPHGTASISVPLPSREEEMPPRATALLSQ